MGSNSLNELKAGPISDAGKGNKNGFSNQPGLHERPPAGRKEILKLLERAIENNGDALKEAMCLFHGLDQRQKEKIMGKMEKRLKKLCGYQFSKEDNACVVRVIADFFAEASECLPKDDEGEKVTDPIKGAVEALMKVAKKTNPDYGKEPYSKARVACLNALWELGCGSYEFWEGHLLGDGTNRETEDFVILSLLEHPPTENPEEHGWHMLKENLGEIGIAVAKSISPKKVEFLRQMLKDDNQEVAAYALRYSIYLEPVPDDFFDIIRDIPPKKKPLLWVEAQNFAQIAHLRKHVEAKHNSRFVAALQLASIYAGGMPATEYLYPMLEEIGEIMAKVAQNPSGKTKEEKDLCRQSALYVIDRLAMTDIEVGVTVDIRSVIEKLLDSPSTGGWQLLKGDLYNVGMQIANNPSPRKTEFLKEMATDHDPRVVTVALQSAAQSPPILKEMAKDANLLLARNAFAIALQMPNLHPEFCELAYQVLKDENKKPVWDAVSSFLHTVNITMAKGDSPDKIENIRKMLQDEDPMKVRYGFAAALYLEISPQTHPKEVDAAQDGVEKALEEFTILAYDILHDKAKEELWDAADDFTRILRLKRKAESPYPAEFVPAISELIELYTPGRKYLFPFLTEIARDMGEALKDPWLETEEEKAEVTKSASGVLKRMEDAGIVKLISPETKDEKATPEAGLSMEVVKCKKK